MPGPIIEEVVAEEKFQVTVFSFSDFVAFD